MPLCGRWGLEGQPARGRARPEGSDVAAYVGTVRRWFCQLTCVEGQFGSADERLARDWQRAGVPPETVRRAILPGSVSKSMGLPDRPAGNRCAACATSRARWKETRTESFPASYWQHLEFSLRRCERVWRQRTAAADHRTRLDLEQASPPRTGRAASSATAVGDREETG